MKKKGKKSEVKGSAREFPKFRESNCCLLVGAISGESSQEYQLLEGALKTPRLHGAAPLQGLIYYFGPSSLARLFSSLSFILSLRSGGKNRPDWELTCKIYSPKRNGLCF